MKRIQWFKDENDFVFGNNTNCLGKIKTLSSWFQYHTGRYCDYCLCFCKINQLNEFAVTAISFRDQLSDVNNNKFSIPNDLIYYYIYTSALDYLPINTHY